MYTYTNTHSHTLFLSHMQCKINLKKNYKLEKKTNKINLKITKINNLCRSKIWSIVDRILSKQNKIIIIIMSK